MRRFPKLYKATKTGALQFWEIEAYRTMDGECTPVNGGIRTTFGQVGTDSPQITEDIIRKGKNVGKKNETSPYDQALAEAQAKWEKQVKKGYVDNMNRASKGEDNIGGVLPMLAHKFSEQGHKIKFPAFIQPKLDGVRCIAIIKNGKATLWSRTRKPITSVPHIVKELETNFVGQSITLDGELYNHSFKDNFEKIISLVRQEEPDDDHHLVQYHIYDLVSEDNFEVRFDNLLKMISDISTPIKLVQTYCVYEDTVDEYFTKFVDEGYEGAILRNMAGLYQNSRSYDLQKVKEFQDAEFEIVGIEEGRGKLAGHVGAFVCKTDDGKQFLAKMAGDTGRLAEIFRNPKGVIGKQLTVKYQGLTGKNGVPRFPVGVVIRDYE